LGSRPPLNLISIIKLLLIVELFSNKTLLFSQVELNGFGRFLQLEKTNGLYSMISTDLDKDGFVDIAGLDSTGRYLLVYFGKGPNQFQSLSRFWLLNKSDGIYGVDLLNKFVANVVSLNKLSGKVEIYTFNKRRLSRIHDISVGYYPDNLAFADLNVSGTKEIICYGKNFRGISIISLQNINFKIQKIDPNNTYSNVTPIFLNSDEFIDLAGISLREQELNIFLNRNLRFSKSTVRKFTNRISHLTSSDFNEDKFQDLCLISNPAKEMIILYGNGLGGFASTGVFQLQYNMSEIIIQDFTKDNLPDILFVDNQSKNIFIKILKEDHNWNLCIPISRIDNLLSQCLYRTRSQIGILFSQAFESNIFLIMNSSLTLERNVFSLASRPISLDVFRQTDEVMNEVCWIDEFDNHFNILKRNEYNTPERIYRIKLLKQFNSFIIHKTLKNNIDIVFFNKGLNYFDYVSFNLIDQTFSRKTITIHGNIDQLLFASSDHLTPNVVALNIKENAYFITIINPFKINPIIVDELLVSSDVIDYNFFFDDRILFYLQPQRSDSFLGLKSKKFNLTFTRFEQNNYLLLEKPKGYDVILSAIDAINNGNYDLLNFISSEKDGYLIVSFYNDKRYSLDTRETEILVGKKKNIRVITNEFSRSKEVYIYNKNTHSVESLLSLRKRKKVLTKKIKEDSRIKEFTVNILPRERRELIYLKHSTPNVYLENF
jgi:hypothetical protein